MDLKEIKDLIIAIDKTSIEEVEIEKDDIKIKIYKGSKNRRSRGDDSTDDIYLYEDKNRYDQKIEKTQESQKKNSQENEEDFFIEKSPIVGVYYSASSPDAEAFVKVGQMVKKGDILCIVEAMKIMNEIEAEMDGEVVEIYAQDEDIIQYGQALLKLRRI
nr:acetyl-CoA carboxylase biotin carboxyl carrier protein [Tissierella sp.]